MSWGPFSPGVGGEERARQLRGLASIVACHLGWRHPAIVKLRDAEGDAKSLPLAFQAMESLPALTLRRIVATHARVCAPRSAAKAG